MSARDELIDTLATADGQEIGAMDLHTKRFMYGKQADAILARYAVVELPEANSNGRGGMQWHVLSRDVHAHVRIDYRGRITSDGVSNPYPGPQSVRSHAAALLAAAKHAEDQS